MKIVGAKIGMQKKLSLSRSKLFVNFWKTFFIKKVCHALVSHGIYFSKIYLEKPLYMNMTYIDVELNQLF